MIANLKYEFFKLFTTRSTYAATGLALLLGGLIAILEVTSHNSVVGALKSDAVSNIMLNAPLPASLIGAVVAILFMTHEYRYGTILYTLTASRSRLKALFAKFLTIAIYSAILGAICIGFGVLCYYIGFALKGVNIPTQTFDIFTIFIRCIGYCVGMALLGLLCAVLVRNVAVSITVLFMLPSIIESLLRVLLKSNAMYLPVTALTQLITSGGTTGSHLSPGMGALVFSGYMVVGWAIAALLFVRRDAN